MISHLKPCSQKAVRCHIYNSERGIMSARWQSKGSYTSSLHRNIALTIILVPKYLREKFRIQLSSRSTLEEHKLRSSQIYMGKKSNSVYSHQSLPQTGLIQRREHCLSPWFSQGRMVRLVGALGHVASQSAFGGAGFYLVLYWAMNNQKSFVPWYS